MFDAGDFRTLVALCPKPGELSALECLTEPDQVRNLQVLLDVAPSSKLKRRNERWLLERTEQFARKIYQLGRPIMIDMSKVERGPNHNRWDLGVLEKLADRLLERDQLECADPATFIPVVPGYSSDAQLVPLRNLCQQLNTGGALRILPRTNLREYTHRVIHGLDVEPRDLDLIIDLQYVASTDRRAVESVLYTLDTVTEWGQFRSYTVLSGSVPRSFSKDQIASWEQGRYEE